MSSRSLDVELDAPPQHVRVRLPALRLAVEAVERGERHRVGGIVLEHRAVRLDGCRGVTDLHLRTAWRSRRGCASAPRPSSARSRLLAVDVEQVVPALGLAVELLERLERDGSSRVRSRRRRGTPSSASSTRPPRRRGRARDASRSAFAALAIAFVVRACDRRPCSSRPARPSARSCCAARSTSPLALIVRWERSRTPTGSARTRSPCR